MKALTLTQPWASLMAAGWKQIETRSWHTNYRGPLVIHSAKTFPAWARDLCSAPPFCTKLNNADASELPLSRGLCVVELIGCIPTDLLQEDWFRAEEMLQHPVGECERDFGNYEPGRYAWITRNQHRMDDPRIVRGALGLWNWPREVHLTGAGSGPEARKPEKYSNEASIRNMRQRTNARAVILITDQGCEATWRDGIPAEELRSEIIAAANQVRNSIYAEEAKQS